MYTHTYVKYIYTLITYAYTPKSIYKDIHPIITLQYIELSWSIIYHKLCADSKCYLWHFHSNALCSFILKTNQPTFSYFSFNRDFFPLILCQLDQLFLYPYFSRCSLRSANFWPDACTTRQSWNDKASFIHLQFWYIKSCKPTTLFTSDIHFWWANVHLHLNVLQELLLIGM